MFEFEFEIRVRARVRVRVRASSTVIPWHCQAHVLQVPVLIVLITKYPCIRLPGTSK